MKKWYLSKTLWSNLIMGVIVVAVPQLKDVFTAEGVAMLFGIVNMALRMITKDKLQLT